MEVTALLHQATYNTNSSLELKDVGDGGEWLHAYYYFNTAKIVLHVVTLFDIHKKKILKTQKFSASRGYKIRNKK